MSSFVINPYAFGAGEDADAAAYLNAVETEDGQALEAGVRKAVDDFVKGCKADGIWSAIKACCILAGARTLDGALTPLVGTAPTSYNFVSGDYDREDGLVGNGSTKYLDSGRNNDADPQDDKHLAVYLTDTSAGNKVPMGAGASSTGDSMLIQANGFAYYRINHGNAGPAFTGTYALGLVGATRSSSSEIEYIDDGIVTTFSSTSFTPTNLAILVYRRGAGAYSNQRLSFYSIGESLDLADLDARLDTLMTDLAAAIP